MFPLGFNGSVCGNPIIIDDDILENDESFSVSISQFDPNIILGPIDNATIVIVDDDGKSTAQHTYMVHLRWSIFYICPSIMVQYSCCGGVSTAVLQR